MIQSIVEKSDLGFVFVIVPTVQFYGSKYNSQSDSWIEMKFYQEFPDIFFYVELKFQDNWSSKRHHNTDQKLIYFMLFGSF